jgi:pseudouridine-5'-monophosphatase
MMPDQAKHFPTTQALPGVPELLSALGRTRYWDVLVVKISSNS